MNNSERLLIAIGISAMLVFLFGGGVSLLQRLLTEPDPTAPVPTPESLHRQARFDADDSCVENARVAVDNWAGANGLNMLAEVESTRLAAFGVPSDEYYVEVFYEYRPRPQFSEISLGLVPRRKGAVELRTLERYWVRSGMNEFWSDLEALEECEDSEDTKCCPGRDDSCLDTEARCMRDEFCVTAGDCCEYVFEQCGLERVPERVSPF